MKRKRDDEEDEDFEPPNKKLKVSDENNSEVHPCNEETQFKIISWNINGINAFAKKEKGKFAKEILDKEDPDIILLQEIKLSKKSQTPKYEDMFGKDYKGYFNISVARKGLHGTAVYLRKSVLKNHLIGKPKFGIGVEEHDQEGRTITLEFEKFFLVNNYIPNSGQKLQRLDYRVDEWDEDLQNYLLELEEEKPIVWAGDLNCAILDLDVHNPKTQKSAGFTPRERKSFGDFLKNNNLIDSFRHFHKDKEKAWTYWGYRFSMRKKNKGWRLDYFVISESILSNLVDSYILKDIYGSDHCPIGLIIQLK